MSATFPYQIGQDIDSELVGDRSGYSVALTPNGGRVAIGATYNDGNGNVSGHVRIFEIVSVDGNTSFVQAGIDIDGESSGDQSGFSVALSADGTRVAIGATYNKEAGQNTGNVRIFDIAGEGASATITQAGPDIDGETIGDRSGYSVALSADGTRVAIGAPYSNGAENVADVGRVRIFDIDGEGAAATITQAGPDIDGAAMYDQSGMSVSLSADGTRIAIGAAFNDDGNSDAGHVRIFDIVGEGASATITQAGPDIHGENQADQSGISVALSADGTRIAIGAAHNDGNIDSLHDNRGHVRIYDITGEGASATFTQAGPDIDGEEAGDFSGYSVSLSADGTRVAIGAIYNDGIDNAVSNAGQVRIYNIEGTGITATVTQIGNDIHGEAADDRSGSAISLSADGTRVAIGAWLNDGNGSNSGHVRIFQVSETPLGTSGGGASLSPSVPDLSTIFTDYLQKDSLITAMDTLTIDESPEVPIVSFVTLIQEAIQSALKRRALVKSLFTKTTKKQLRMNPAELQLTAGTYDNTKQVLVIKPNETVSIAADSTDILYSPISEADEFITFTFDDHTITFTAAGDGTYTATVDGASTNATYNEDETHELGGRLWLFGSVQEVNVEGGGGSAGDPYIFCI